MEKDNFGKGETEKGPLNSKRIWKMTILKREELNNNTSEKKKNDIS